MACKNCAVCEGECQQSNMFACPPRWEIKLLDGSVAECRAFSVGQAVDHLVKSNTSFAEIAKAAARRKKNVFEVLARQDGYVQWNSFSVAAECCITTRTTPNV